MNKARLTLKAIALTLGIGLLNPMHTSAEHLIKRLQPYQANGYISPEYLRWTSFTISEESVPHMIRHYEVDGISVRTFNFPLFSISGSGGLSFVYPKYPQGYRIEDKEVAELYHDPNIDGLNGNEVMTEQIKKPVDKEPMPSIPSSLDTKI